MSETRPRINLRFWQGAGDLLRLATAADIWWDRIQNRLGWLTGQVDAETAPLTLVNLLAWQRDIDRLKNEPERLYRLRVKYALANAKDAGCMAGFERIWERLDLGYVGQSERIDPVDWDVIQLELSESVIAGQPDLLETIIRQYGRTCRRYYFSTITPLTIRIRCFDFEHRQINAAAVATEINAATLRTRPIAFGNSTELIVAKG